MMLAVILIAVAFSVLGSLMFLAKKGRALTRVNANDFALSIHPVDIDAFRNLVDPHEEQFLRESLSDDDFREVNRERLRAAVEYVTCVAKNAAILMHVGENARHSLNPSVAEAGNRLVSSALHLRRYAFLAYFKLYMGIVLPGRRVPVIAITEDYEKTARLGVVLGCLRQPRSASTVVSA